jgi:pimeloyl-ACP methyl ester carboxylesterase
MNVLQKLRTVSGRIKRKRAVRRAAAGLVGVLTAIGVVSVYNFLAGPPGVGHFRSVEGRQEYARRYAEAMAALAPPAATHDVPTDFGTVRVYEWSSPATASSVPVVLVPGRSSGVPMWSANLAGFARTHRVLAFDALGDAGMSVQAAPVPSFASQAIWIHQVLTRLAPGGVHLVGHSFGGATAAAYARQHPEHVRSLTLLEPVFTFASPPARLMAWAMIGSLPVLPDSIRETALGKIGGVEYDGTDPIARMIAAGARRTRHRPTRLLGVGAVSSRLGSSGIRYSRTV